jgi:hypothetical protein
MGGSESRVKVPSSICGMLEICSAEKHPAKKQNVDRKRPDGNRTSGSFKKTNNSLNSEIVGIDSPPKIGGHPSSDRKLNTSSSDLSMDAEHVTAIPQSGSWRGSNSSFRSSGKGAAMLQSSCCDWPSAEQRALENAVEMAAAYMKLKPPGFFAVQVCTRI